MFKSIITVAIALSMTTPAMAQRRSNNLADYPFPSESQRAEMAAQQSNQQSSSQSIPQNRAYNDSFTDERLAFAQVASERAYNRCRGSQNAATLIEGLSRRLTKDRYGYSGRGDDAGYCEGVAQQVFNRTLEARPTAYCNRTMDSVRGPDGRTVAGGNTFEQCNATRIENWDASLRR